MAAAMWLLEWIGVTAIFLFFVVMGFCFGRAYERSIGRHAPSSPNTGEGVTDDRD